MKHYAVGFDIGTDSVHSVVLTPRLEVEYAPEALMHFGNPADALKEIFDEIISRYGQENIATTAFTGSGGEYFAQALKVPFFYDTLTIPAGVGIIAPWADHIFHIGAKDPYYFRRETIQEANGSRAFVPDHATGTKCGGGSGILMAKQCRRFFEGEVPVSLGDDRKTNRALLQQQLETIFGKAEGALEAATRDIDVGGRCGVVIQSDMIHLQNRGEEIPNILKGLCDRIVKNYRSDVLKTRAFGEAERAVVTGGIFGNHHLVDLLSETLNLSIEVPELFRSAGAIGAVICAGHVPASFRSDALTALSQAEKSTVKTAPALSSALDKVRIYDEPARTTKIKDLSVFDTGGPAHREVILGMDGGSTTTKAIVADASTLAIVAEICLNTNGRPLQAAKEIFRQIRDTLGDDLTIRAVAYTGSSGAFYHKLFTDTGKTPEQASMDIVKDEITCHAYGVKHFNDKVDTIFELGGQDAKFTLFNTDGTVKKSRMNLSCMAGTGQTMQNMVEMIGLDIGTSFHEYALRAERTPIVDDTCGVFTEAGIARLVALGFPKEEVAAAIAYGFMGGYVNKFIGNEPFGDFASAQGGPFKGTACLAALSLHTGMEVHAFPHRQLFGALGAAIAAHQALETCRKKGIPADCKFRGLGLADTEFTTSEALCSRLISDSCSLKDCKLQVYTVGHDRVLSGGACPKGNTDSGSAKAPDYVAKYKKIMNRHLTRFTSPLDSPSDKERVLIPRSLTFLNEKGIFYAALYHHLGFEVALSPESDDRITNLGIHYSHSETCFPVKLAHGHAAFLKEHVRQGKDKILLVNAIGALWEKNRFCPYVAGDGFLAKDAVGIDNGDVLLPVLHFDDSAHPMEKAVWEDLSRVFGTRFTLGRVFEAVESARKAEAECLFDIYSRGEKIIEGLTVKGENIFMGIGRGYTLLDNKAGSRIHELFASHGLHFVPAFFTRPPEFDISDIAENMYWVQGKTIIRYTLETALGPNLYPVRATNFNCGTDSILLYHEEAIMNKAGKPHLILQTDGHSSNAQFGTRTLANNEVVKTHRPKPVRLADFRRKIRPVVLKNKRVGIPYMGDNSHVLAATFRSMGFTAEVMPTQTGRAQEIARKMVGTNTCMPFAYQVGDCLAWLYSLMDRGINPNTEAVVFQPMAQGPCRFGQYHVILKQLFRENGLGNVDILSPDAEKDYTNVPVSDWEILRQAAGLFKGTSCLDILGNALLRTRPYEKETGSTQALYDSLTDELYAMVARRAGSKEYLAFMARAQEGFQGLIDPGIPRKPVVVINGEIFVRLHRNANQESILLLEKYGLEVMLSPLGQWMGYTNKTAIEEFKKAYNWKRLVLSMIKKSYMQSRGKKLTAPFRDFLKGRESHDSEHLLSQIQKDLVYDRHIQGESPISIGEAYLFTKGEMPRISGIYHVGPFGCMQETAATSQIQSITQKHRMHAGSPSDRIVPFMDAVFGDSELPNLEAEIAAFAQKCYLKQEMQGNQGIGDRG